MQYAGCEWKDIVNRMLNGGCGHVSAVLEVRLYDGVGSG